VFLIFFDIYFYSDGSRSNEYAYHFDFLKYDFYYFYGYAKFCLYILIGLSRFLTDRHVCLSVKEYLSIFKHILENIQRIC
jgi:hypothetical protein